jgi:hypothetical protein
MKMAPVKTFKKAHKYDNILIFSKYLLITRF